MINSSYCLLLSIELEPFLQEEEDEGLAVASIALDVGSSSTNHFSDIMD